MTDKKQAFCPVDKTGILDIELICETLAEARACAQGRPVYLVEITKLSEAYNGDDDFTRIVMGRT